METPIVQIIYASAARHKMDKAELEDILCHARRHNAPNGITGMLLYHAGSFLQILEGKAQKLDALVAKIQRDPRHNAFRLLLRAHTVEREFPEWTMGFVDTTGLREEMDGFIAYEQAFASALDDTGAARKVLNSFKNGGWRQFVEN